MSQRPSGAAAVVTARASTTSRDAARSRQSRSTGRAAMELVAAQAPPSHRAFLDSVLAELGRRDPDGSRLAGATDVDQAASLAVDRVLDPSVLWLEHLGAFYDTDGVRALLSRSEEPISRQAVHKRKGLLALTTGSGRVVYPAFQFQDRRLVPGLAGVLAALDGTAVSRWTIASWLVSPEAELEGERPIDVLAAPDRAGQDRVVQIARSWSTQLAG